jgi:hypothetical protein
MKLSNSPPVRVVARTIGCLLFAFAFSGCASIELLPRSSPDVPVVPPYGPHPPGIPSSGALRGRTS